MQNELKYVIFKTKWGFFGLLADKRGIIRTSLPVKTIQAAKKYLLVGIFWSINEDKKLYPELQEMVKGYYNRSYINLNKLFFRVSFYKHSVFSCKVLKACTTIPLGETITYSQLARRSGFSKAGRAVGNILAKNPLPLIVPCHRVIRADGKIGNFSAPGGARTKKKMIEHEKMMAAKGQGTRRKNTELIRRRYPTSQGYEGTNYGGTG